MRSYMQIGGEARLYAKTTALEALARYRHEGKAVPACPSNPENWSEENKLAVVIDTAAMKQGQRKSGQSSLLKTGSGENDGDGELLELPAAGTGASGEL